MKIPASTSLRRLLSFVAFACSVLAAGSLGAQSAATGSIQGRIFNPASQEYVRNAEVRLDGTNQVTYSENDGSFQFANVAAGTAAITVTYTGYNTVKESFTVTAGQPAVREINMSVPRPLRRPARQRPAKSCNWPRSPFPPNARVIPRRSWISAGI
jgi:hypothetical protein